MIPSIESSQLSVDDEFLKFCQSTFRPLVAVMVFAADDWLLRVLSLCLNILLLLAVEVGWEFSARYRSWTVNVEVKIN